MLKQAAFHKGLYHTIDTVRNDLPQASPIWDISLPPFDGPLDAEAIPKRRDRQVADVVASELKRALAPNGGLGVVGERGKAVYLLKDAQVHLRGFDTLEAAEVSRPVGQDRLVMLVEAAND